ncbi:MAG: hypothetical protein GQ574_13360 [Crocinitomix sp.]|nr:hypothetical protein [Crocinitomix sp.]
MKKIIGVILFIIGLGLLVGMNVYYFMTEKRIGNIFLNILCFFIMALGWSLFKGKWGNKTKVDSSKHKQDKSSKTQTKARISLDKNKEEQMKGQEFEKSDHSRYMPK